MDNGNPALSFSRTFAVIVTQVNQPPTLDPIGNVTVPQNTSAVNVAEPPITLTGIGPGAGDVNQTVVNVFATSSNPALVTNPSITYTAGSATAMLTYSVLPNVFGTATITVTAMDNGGVANGGVNFVKQSFTVTVSPVSQPPTLNPITPNPLVLPVSPGMQTVNLTGLGDGNGGTENITVTASSDNTALILNPGTGAGALVVNYTSPIGNPGGTLSTGTVTFTPVPGVQGVADITVTVTNTGNSTGGPLSFSQVFIVAVAPAHVAPVVTTSPGSASFVQGSGPIPVDSLVGVTDSRRHAQERDRGHHGQLREHPGRPGTERHRRCPSDRPLDGDGDRHGDARQRRDRRYDHRDPGGVRRCRIRDPSGGHADRRRRHHGRDGHGGARHRRDRGHGRRDQRHRAGSGYTAAPTVTIAPPTAPATIGTVTLNGSGSITIPVASGGAGYLIPPVVKLIGGTFTTAATATANLGTGATAGMVVSITVNGGTGYTAVPTVTIAPPAVPATAGTVTLKQRQHHDPGCQRRQRLPDRSGGHADGRHIHHRRDGHGGARHRPDRGHGRVDHRQRRGGLHRGPDRHDRPTHAAHRKLQRNERRPDLERRRSRVRLPGTAAVGHIQGHQHQPLASGPHGDVHRE